MGGGGRAGGIVTQAQAAAVTAQRVGPGSYDVERGLRFTRERSVAAPPLSRTPRFGSEDDSGGGGGRWVMGGRQERGAATRSLFVRHDGSEEATKWWSRGGHIPRGGRDDRRVMDKAAARSEAPDVVYPWDKAPSKRGVAEQVQAGAAHGSQPLRSALPRFPPTPQQVGSSDGFASSRVDNAGRLLDVGDRLAAAKHAPSPPLVSRTARFGSYKVGNGADAVYDVARYRSIEDESKRTLRGTGALRKQGREMPVMRRDAAAIGWSNNKDGSKTTKKSRRTQALLERFSGNRKVRAEK